MEDKVVLSSTISGLSIFIQTNKQTHETNNPSLNKQTTNRFILFLWSILLSAKCVPLDLFYFRLVINSQDVLRWLPEGPEGDSPSASSSTMSGSSIKVNTR